MSEDKKEPGRPVGSRNKTKLTQAQTKLDDLALLSIDTAEALLKNDKEFLDTKEDVTNSLRFQVIKFLVDKAVANEKDKLEDTAPAVPAANSNTGPKVFASAKKTPLKASK